MNKHTINVPSVEEFARPRTRMDFLKALAAASVGAVAGSAVLAGSANASSHGGGGAAPAGGDLEIANFALTLEYLEAEFYGIALDSGVLSGEALPAVENLFAHESAHVDALIGLITENGGTPVAKPEFTFPEGAFSSQASILDLAFTFEPVGVGAYLGAGTMITAAPVLAAAASIAGVEGEHVVTVGNLIGVVPPANTAFPAALTQDEVLAAVAPFIGMGSMMDTGGEQPAASSGKAY
jgi:hypothetical protein